ncbi:hypothetical protein Tco_0115888 [Tanacetum coccineum]|uniref:Uncharacterized protein n=1 Tax=Tanacetum coccineum TaxID=301880 RepID=A0ABQ5ABW7_9ASTR
MFSLVTHFSLSLLSSSHLLSSFSHSLISPSLPSLFCFWFLSTPLFLFSSHYTPPSTPPFLSSLLSQLSSFSFLFFLLLSGIFSLSNYLSTLFPSLYSPLTLLSYSPLYYTLLSPPLLLSTTLLLSTSLHVSSLFHLTLSLTPLRQDIGFELSSPLSDYLEIDLDQAATTMLISQSVQELDTS